MAATPGRGAVRARSAGPRWAPGPIDLDEIPERALIRGFLSVPNNADLFGRGVSHNGPHADYAAFLDDLDGREAFPRDWLIPAGLTVRDFHDAPAGTR